MKSLTEHLWFEVPDRRGFINITPKIEELVHRSDVMEGLCLVNAMVWTFISEMPVMGVAWVGAAGLSFWLQKWSRR